MGEHPLFAIDIASGEAKKLVGDGTISSFEIAGPTLAFSRNSMKTGNQLFTTGMDAAQLRAITPSAGEMVTEATFADFEQFSFKGWTDDTVYGNVGKSWNEEEGKERKRVVKGKSASIRVGGGGRRNIQ